MASPPTGTSGPSETVRAVMSQSRAQIRAWGGPDVPTGDSAAHHEAPQSQPGDKSISSSGTRAKWAAHTQRHAHTAPVWPTNRKRGIAIDLAAHRRRKGRPWASVCRVGELVRGDWRVCAPPVARLDAAQSGAHLRSGAEAERK